MYFEDLDSDLLSILANDRRKGRWTAHIAEFEKLEPGVQKVAKFNLHKDAMSFQSTLFTYCKDYKRPFYPSSTIKKREGMAYYFVKKVPIQNGYWEERDRRTEEKRKKKAME